MLVPDPSLCRAISAAGSFDFGNTRELTMGCVVQLEMAHLRRSAVGYESTNVLLGASLIFDWLPEAFITIRWYASIVKRISEHRAVRRHGHRKWGADCLFVCCIDIAVGL